MNASQALSVIRKCIAAQGNPDGAAPSKLGWEGTGSSYNGTAVISPTMWREKGNDVSDKVVAVILHEGPGPLSRFFSLDACAPNGWGKAEDYATYEAMCGSEGALLQAGIWAETQTTWHSFIYPQDD